MKQMLFAAALGLTSAAQVLTDDPRGPIVAAGIRAALVAGGVEAKDFRYTPEKLPAWSAQWIWLDESLQKISVGCFRKELELKSVPAKAVAWVSADKHYRLFVNGHLVARGPADAGEDYPGGKSGGKTGLYYADQVDLAPFLRPGPNVIAAEVFANRLSAWYGSTGHGGFFFQSDLLKLKSDATWRCSAGEYFDAHGKYSGAKEPAGWRLPGFATAWPPCVPTDANWPKLLASVLPNQLEIAYPALKAVRASAGLEVPEHPFRGGKSVKIARDGSFALLFDRVQCGYVGLKVKGGTGATLSVGLHEQNAPGAKRTAALELGGGVQYYESPFYGSYVALNIAAKNVKEPFEIEDVRSIHTSQPVAYRGAFACDNDALNRLWQACRWQTQICMQDRYLDSPDHQEPISDPGDYLIESLESFYAFGAPWLTQQDARKFGALLAHNDYINFHTSYALLWLQMVLDYWQYTGDDALVRELSTQIFGLLDKFATWRGKNGLLSEAPDYMFMDWVKINGIACHHPPAGIGQGYLTAFYCRGLADGIRTAELIGDAARAAKYKKLRGEMAAAFNRELWDESRGLYRDGKPFQSTVKPGKWLPADQDMITFSAQVNALAVLYDLAPPERQAAIMTLVMAERPQPNCQPYFMHFVLDALAHAGLFDRLAVAQMERWQIDPVTQTFPEMWNRGDMSHGWGGTPLIQMSARILGVTPLEPGCRTLAIRPQLCGLKWAKGAVPVPQGLVEVDWKLVKNGWQLEVVLPKGSAAEVTLPLNHFKSPAATINGTPLATDHPARLTPGKHLILITGSYFTEP